MTRHTPSIARVGKPATLDDVAALAAVSRKTVSRVVNSEEGIQPATRRRVLHAIEQLDYKPNLNARMLAAHRSYTIALFYDEPGGYLSDFQSGAAERCRESGFHLVLKKWDRDDPRAIQHLTMLLRQIRPEGAILLPPLSDDRLVCNILHDASIPAVRIAPREKSSRSPCIRTDDYLASRQLTAHLMKLGHRRIGFILGKPGHGATEQRYRGFYDEMQARGAEVDPALVETGHFMFTKGVACAQKMLRNPHPPTAICASNDDMAAAVISVAHRLGLTLPGALSVVGFDDSPVATMIWPLLTTVRQPITLMARHAADLIISHHSRKASWPKSFSDTVFDFELLIRESTAPPLPSSSRSQSNR
jgi:LacI family transcriptional regulator